MLCVLAAVTLLKYVRKGYLFIFGGTIILSGAYTVLVEFLLYVVSLMIFPLVAAHTPLAYLLQLLLLALVLATGLCVSLPYTPGHSHLPAPFPLALALCWLLFQ